MAVAAALRLCAMLCCPPLLLGAAQSLPPAARAADRPCPTAAAHVVRSAKKLCGGAPIAASLQSVGIGGDRTGATAELLAKHGFQTVLDLRLLRAGGAEEAELMEQLRAARISIGDRSKVRLLLGLDGSELLRSDSAHQQCGGSDRAEAGFFTRQLQDGADEGMSVDTIAIVASVLVGAAGYLVQAYTARRAEQSTAAQAQELHLHEQTRQREHEQMLSQIARVDRWLDDCARVDTSVLSCCVGPPACGRD
eukprot:SAG31_NODE_102_length_25175_cov_10.778553_23_plen_251_part_00